VFERLILGRAFVKGGGAGKRMGRRRVSVDAVRGEKVVPLSQICAEEAIAIIPVCSKRVEEVGRRMSQKEKEKRRK